MSNTKEYSNGKIYKIIDNTNNNIYIGSTMQTLAHRLQNHKGNYKKYLNGKYHYVTSYEIIKNNDFKIELLEDCSHLTNKKDVEKREQHHILTLDCVNKQIPARSKKEYYEQNKTIINEKKKQYAEANKEKFAAYKREWTQANKERLKEKKRAYELANKEQHDAYKRKYYENNRELINERKRLRRLAKKLEKQASNKVISL